MKRIREWVIPELLRLENEDYRYNVFQHAMKHSRIQWWFAALTPILTFTLIMSPLKRRGYLIYALGSFGFTIVAMLAFIALGYGLFRPGLRRLARTYMRRHYGIAVCGPCGYDLTGNTSGVCSECGTKIDAGQRATPATREK